MPGARALVAGLAVAVVLAGPAAAETLTMRSGEHRGFTRLTLPVPPEGGWVLGRVGDGYGLRLTGAGASVDTSAVFTRIRRDRLAEVRMTETGVDLVLGCDCHAVAFEERGLIVVDLRDGPPPEGARFEARLGPDRPEPPSLRPGFDWTQSVIPSAGPVAQGPVATPQPSSGPDFGTDPARDLLARQFSRAVAQGLIRADVGRAQTIEARLREATPPAALPPASAPLVPAAPEGLTARAQPLDALDNLRIGATTGIDRARDASGRSGVNREGAACPPDSRFDLAAWGTETDLARQIAQRRQDLLGEFDQPDPARVLDLARLYLHAGFGAEARALLETLPPSSADAPVLLGIAALIDGPEPPSEGGSAFDAHVGCDGAVAMWAVLGAPDLARAGVIDRLAVRRAFAALPAHLRTHIGPRLAQRFLDLSDTDTALALRAAIAPTATRPAAVAVLDAELELAQGRPGAASDIAEAAADGGGPGSAEALATLVEARLAGGLSIPAEVVEDLVAVARENAGTALGLRLARLEGVALAQQGLFDAAFAVRDRLGADAASGPLAAAMSRDLLGRLAHTGSDAALMARVFAEAEWREGTLPPADRRRLAERLLEAGFPAEALAALPSDPSLAQDAFLAGRALLAIDAPGQALRVLAGHRDADAERLRGEALLALGEHGAAVTVFSEAGLQPEAHRAAWLGGLWQDAAQDAGDATAAMIARAGAAMPVIGADAVDASLLPPVVAPPGFAREAASEGELAQAAAMLVDGAELRRMVADLLSAYPPPSD
ncbi:hypothetical protein [Rhodobaculum claviforme]|uniref:Uncharacterized protein n=1 Tax=Rhodobaculum claviforme TaxID=1549854 RepID=A0A934TN01_9RHOB|nr:hypothetical protein [Rhodobaculum claviforme]MBK5928554.1 hypothetical protein [Rhodobaculum claviforme]